MGDSLGRYKVGEKGSSGPEGHHKRKKCAGMPSWEQKQCQNTTDECNTVLWGDKCISLLGSLSIYSSFPFFPHYASQAVFQLKVLLCQSATLALQLQMCPMLPGLGGTVHTNKQTVQTVSSMNTTDKTFVSFGIHLSGRDLAWHRTLEQEIAWERDNVTAWDVPNPMLQLATMQQLHCLPRRQNSTEGASGPQPAPASSSTICPQCPSPVLCLRCSLHLEHSRQGCVKLCRLHICVHVNGAGGVVVSVLCSTRFGKL